MLNFIKKIKYFLIKHCYSRPFWFVVKKKYRANFCKLGFKKDKNLKTLIDNGIFLGKNIIPSKIIDLWSKKYGINDKNFFSSTSNISFPFYNEELHNIILKSELPYFLIEYFQILYKKKPILQCHPQIIVTKPSIGNESFQSGKEGYAIPANWHTDYFSEFSIHIPLVNISASTTHTSYIAMSQSNFSKANQYLDKSKNIVKCF